VALNPFGILSTTKLDEDTYKHYIKLEGLSRRARYLCNELNSDQEETSFFTHDKHLSRAIRHLDSIMVCMANKYGISFSEIELDCIELQSKIFTFFKYVKKESVAV